MNTKLNAIFSRRSIRSYEAKEIPEGILKNILKAAMSAPSACAKDPWDFLVIKDKKMLADIAAGLPNGKMLVSAALGIVVCGDIQKAHANELSYMLQDCSAAIENILVSAGMLGIGTCWLGVHPREERIVHIRKLLSIPDNIIPLAVISMGYPAEKKEARTRYSDAAVHFEKW
ncbi:MAG: NADH dehydrogenase [Lentisphaerae bacterium GWF2_44_16]|nr:MAG: NADH dehydrogenase [Lentisphaerae bacterium GWF2_44_16]